MLSQKSLRTRFALQLASAGAMLIVIFSVMLYHYIKITIFENVVVSLSEEAKQISKRSNFNLGDMEFYYPAKDAMILKIIENTQNITAPKFAQSVEGDKSFLTLYYPYKNNLVLSLRKNTTEYSQIVSQILTDILIINATAIFLILFFALFLSRMMLLPIKELSQKLTRLNENFLCEMNISELSDEFKPLGVSINKLISRMQTFAKYQKELFIGAAHELKTPLAVMKTKNEVTLIKEREVARYIESLRSNNESIDQMNKMISSILEIGRQEGAQFDKPAKVDVIKYLDEISKNFILLARGEGKEVVTDLNPRSLVLTLQTNLLNHVVQNFVQNAIKFSPENGTVNIRSELLGEKFIISVFDEGEGVDESKDLFAPFKRYGNKSGSGLGLFLAKGAAQALGGSVSIANRNDGKRGAIATLTLPVKSQYKKFQI